MNTNLKVVLSAVALATFVAAPAVAKSRTQRHNTQAPAYSNNTVVQNGHVLGADPDSSVRFNIRREGKYWLDE
jgi:hypothetical protein